MRRQQPYRVLQGLLRELDNVLHGMTETEAAHLLAKLRAECRQRMLRLDPDQRQHAEMEATSPLRLLHRR